jgi:uncharacterized protein
MNKYYSYNNGELPEGCKQCVQGKKLVLFITGKCPRKCFYCPISDEKKDKDVIFANERRIFKTEDIVKEAKLMNAQGAGFTGGDPLVKVDRCVRYIKVLKHKFGNDFHIHLYTSLRLVNDSSLQRLFQAGLDEIRFHPDIKSDQFWYRVDLALKFPWKVGIEIPLIPDMENETKKLLEYFKDKVNFINLNELEISDNSHSELLTKGYETKDKTSYAVKGSLEMGLKLMENMNHVHLCTAKLKDKVQLANRIINQSVGVKKSFDIVDKEGLLERGAIYLNGLEPGFSYRKKLNELTNDEKNTHLKQLQLFYGLLKDKLSLKDDDLFIDEEKLRLILAKDKVKKNKKTIIGMNLIPAVVKEYPTADQLEIEVSLLN